MTPKLYTVATIITLLFLNGCGQIVPDLNGKNNISDASQIAGETVSIDENSYGNESSGGYNSSSNGFKSIYFDFADYTISSNMEDYMQTNVKIASQTSSKIKIEGNCDEFGTDEYNYALGLKRAKAVRDGIAAQGVERSKMVIVSFGESSPVCNEPSDSCYDRNRRVDIRLVK